MYVLLSDIHQGIVSCNRIQPALEASVASVLKVRLIDRKLREGMSVRSRD